MSRTPVRTGERRPTLHFNIYLSPATFFLHFSALRRVLVTQRLHFSQSPPLNSSNIPILAPPLELFPTILSSFATLFQKFFEQECATCQQSSIIHIVPLFPMFSLHVFQIHCSNSQQVTSVSSNYLTISCID